MIARKGDTMKGDLTHDDGSYAIVQGGRLGNRYRDLLDAVLWMFFNPEETRQCKR